MLQDAGRHRRRVLCRVARAALYLGLFALAGVGAVRYTVRRALPQLEGVEHLEGLRDDVEVVRDRWGVPHLYARNLHDLFFAQGYVHAQDRLWQMEFQRRVGSGRLSETVGPLGLETDRFMRRLGLRRAAEKEATLLQGQDREAMEAYADGVNAFAQAPGRRLGLEFSLLRLRPEPWQPADSIVWAKVLAWGLGTNWDTELLRAKIIERLGPELMALLEPSYPSDHPCLIPSETHSELSVARLMAEYERVREVVGLAASGAGSNNWVVGGRRTASGKPLLANDPHLPPQLPAVWYQIHLSAPRYEVVGASIPGSPGVVIGHNRRIAWGVTNSCVDAQDLYVEQRHPSDPTLYRFRSDWIRAEVVREEIKVRGWRLPVVEEVHITHHGPLLSPSDDYKGQPLALRWSGLEPGSLVGAALAINRAQNWDEFCSALRRWTDPAQNFVYADVEGHIGYYLAGRVPMRARGVGMVPSLGWTGEHEWTGYVPFEELPHLLDPASQLIVTANNQIVDEAYPHHISREWLNGYRCQRISDLLESRPLLTVQDCCAVQSDLYSLSGVQLASHLRRLLPSNSLEAEALAELEEWDGHLRSESAGAAVCQMTLLYLQRRVLGPALGPLLDEYLGAGRLEAIPTNSFLSRSTPLLLDKLESDDRAWLQRVLAAGRDGSGPSPSWKEVLHEAFSAAVTELRSRLGGNVRRWSWGGLHRLVFAHPLGRIRLLDRLLSRGPYPFGGDADTVCNSVFLPRDGCSPVVATGTYRQVIDLADLDCSLMGSVPGQSGHLASPHYADQIEDWLQGKLHPVPFERLSVLASAKRMLRLEKA